MHRTPLRMLATLSIAVPLVAQTQAVPRIGHAATLPPVVASRLDLLSAAQIKQLAPHPTQKVIVLLRAGPAAGGSSQTPLLRELRAVGAQRITPFRLIDAVSATVSPAEATRLGADPAVQAVVPDRIIREEPRITMGRQAATGLPDSVTAALPPPGLKLKQQTSRTLPACTNSATPSLEPEALQLTNTASNDPGAPQSRRLLGGSGKHIDGSGVTVAFMADGVDVNNPDFLRPNGTHVFVDYQDFTGEGTDVPTGGGQAFLSASSIAAQGRKTYDVNGYLMHKWARPCPIRIEGMAPGAKLVALKVYGQYYQTTTSAFVQAVEYAAIVDHIDVLSEFLGSNPYPDLANSPIALVNAAAVAAGVTVVVAVGDAGANNTISAPASAPDVIAVGATTQLRPYSQTGLGIAYLGNGSYINNNVAPFSSGGFTVQGPRTVDVVAPGDSSWAVCTPSRSSPPAFSDCINLANKPSSIQLFSSTSAAAPLTAGEAALVIQAYRAAHHGRSPSPALVKQIIMSSASDLGIPVEEQGAGLIDSYRAVQQALSYANGVGSHGQSLLVRSDHAFSAVAAPNSARHFTFRVTNTGTARQVVTPRLRTLGQPFMSHTYSLLFDPVADPQEFIDVVDVREAFTQQILTVPAGTQRLTVRAAYLVAAQPSTYLQLALFDPNGRLAGYTAPNSFSSIPTSGYLQVSARAPQPGAWRAVISTAAYPIPQSYHGTVRLTADYYRFKAAGTLAPATRTIPPGATAAFVATVRMPAQPGDQADEIVFPVPGGAGSEAGAIPIGLRSTLAIGPKGGSFTGVLRGGIGQFNAPGQSLTYQFAVPSGKRDMELAFRVADPNSNLEGVLVDPAGEPVDVQSTAVHSDAATGEPDFFTATMQFYRWHPKAGTYELIVFINNNGSGGNTSQPFEVQIGFNRALFQVSGVPNDPKRALPAGKPVDASLLVANPGIVAKQFFLDPRLDALGPVPLLAPDSFSISLPLTATQQAPYFFVPPAVSEIQVTSTSPTPINFDLASVLGAAPFGGTASPDIYESSGAAPGKTTALYSAGINLKVPEVASGPWQVAPSEVGPYPGGALPSTVDIKASAIGQPFDQDVFSSTGDLWSPFSPGFRPLVLPPQTYGPIRVEFVPVGKPGTVVRGTLYVESYSGESNSTDEVIAVPYAYKVGQ